MPSGQAGLIGQAWAGLRRDIAPFALQDESPDTKDAGLYNDIANILGQRRGCVRRYNQNTNIIGVIPFDFPFGSGRIICGDDGTWNAVSAPAAPGPAAGFFTGVETALTSVSCVAGVLSSTSVSRTMLGGLRIS